MTKVLSTYLSHRCWVWGRAKGLDFKLFHEQLSNERSNGRTPGSTIDLFVILTLEEEVSVSEAKLQECDYLLYRGVGPVVLF